MAKRQEVEPMPEVTIGRERPFYSAILGDEIIEALALGVVPAVLQAEAVKLLRWKTPQGERQAG
jgi:hypothetical protein